MQIDAESVISAFPVFMRQNSLCARILLSLVSLLGTKKQRINRNCFGTPWVSSRTETRARTGIIERVLVFMRLVLNRLPVRLCFLVALAGTVFLSACATKTANRFAKPGPRAQTPTVETSQQQTDQPGPEASALTPTEVTPTSIPNQQQPADAVAEMIAQAEKAFESGQANYKAGHLEAAKQDFNRAVDLLMQGPIDVKSDARLEEEFAKITEQITQLEMAAFKAGDGFTEQQSEPAPIDEANQVTFPADPNVKAKAEAELRNTHSDLPLMINDYVAGYINYFSTRGRGVFERAVVRSGRYRDMIVRVFQQEGVPQDLIYLAQAESGFHPLALSRARARGMWQFMASRAVDYGLRRTWWVDDRQDPERSTRAAARHLKDLYNEFGDWYLAMAAYNSGPGNVQQAVKRTGYADFWELYKRNVLPVETKNYVPIILAMTIMSKNPAQYGLSTIQPDAPEHYDVVPVDYPVDLRLVAECVEAPLDELVSLNPSLLRRTTPKDQRFDLHLPEGSKDKYQSAIAAIPKDKRVAWRYYRVQRGDTLAGIARKYHTTEHAIEQANSLESSELLAEVRLVIPASAPEGDPGKIHYSRYASRYRVHAGDTVLTVAEDFGVAPERVRRWNQLKGNELHRGRLLVIYKPLAPGEADRVPPVGRRRKKTTHTAKAASGTPSPHVSKETLSARTP
jgi:membrane-bound lytic murein transglycosylase D